MKTSKEDAEKEVRRVKEELKSTRKQQGKISLATKITSGISTSVQQALAAVGVGSGAQQQGGGAAAGDMPSQVGGIPNQGGGIPNPLAMNQLGMLGFAGLQNLRPPIGFPPPIP